ncbi:NUDIX domain-containing protein [Gracilimonas sp. Q87]|uniref:NUDIX domain-containing protein n=1 Tax=Gracilimonas sp. Q87 TaxID=3384766 RepID=UPI00398403F4
MKKLIDVYPYKIVNGEVHFLVLKRSSSKIYAEQWRMIGGKVKSGETSWNAGLRELQEETGLKPLKYWSVPSVNQFYEHTTDMIHSIPAFAAELSDQGYIKLDDEHTGYKWITIQQISDFIKWPEQQRLMKLIDELLKNETNEILPEWIIEV